MMKKFFIFPVLIFTFAAVFAPSVLAYAEDMGGYPDLIREPLTFENLKDYAVASGGESYLFADGSKLILWTSDENTLSFNVDLPVTAVDCEENVYYYATKFGKYKLPASPEELPGEKTEHDFSKPKDKENFPKRDDLLYYFDGQNVFHVLKTEKSDDKPLNGYTVIKTYNDKVYGVKDNALYNVTEGEPIAESLFYSNYNLFRQIPVYSALETLKTFSARPKIVNVNSQATLTELNPDKVSEDDAYFYTGDDELSVQKNTCTNVSGPAILLAEAGNTAVITQSDKMYILNKNSITIGDSELYTESLENENVYSTPNVPDYAYSLPFVSRSTAAFEIKPQDNLKILASVPKRGNSTLAHDFYIVEINEARGYVPSEFLNDFSTPPYNEGNAGLVTDPSPEDGDNVRTVVLVLLVILLILIAAGYLTYLFTGSKKAAKGRKFSKDNIDEDVSDGKFNDL